MDYIVLDIEFNGRKFASELPMEVIEIGAVRLDADMNQIDTFTSLIKPVYFAKLNNFIKKKTGIPQADIDIAPGFRKVSADFIAWLSKSESFLLITWGGEDLKRIIYDTRMHKQDDAFWMAATYFDLLKGYLRVKNVTNDVSVEAALAELAIEAEGSAHRALDDAIMTAKILRAIAGGLDFTRSQQFKDAYSNSKERRMVKNAIRSMRAQRQTPQWETLVEKYLKDRIALTDPRKSAELEQYFHEELAKPVSDKPVREKPETADTNA
ncbi:3'-5' exonuclease [Paenibacillus methanolicus]|uniref:Inhibitor of KinA sporulation pathway (Predicted exonuclease) n=1 Tax=Paenibacillus methanolicus TaxID=582686 RepID=A0A5S5CIB3_9BACL|nr:3'-5' exonuclease [Paenibacillus methanolicus]TYP79462.1 inhibitor of KinA sporulation pathway (predicted exonuclease) [Paenibacillus methanolicus]